MDTVQWLIVGAMFAAVGAFCIYLFLDYQSRTTRKPSLVIKLARIEDPVVVEAIEFIGDILHECERGLVTNRNVQQGSKVKRVALTTTSGARISAQIPVSLPESQ